MKPAFVLSGQASALGVVRALGTMGVPIVLIHYNDKDFAHHSRFIKTNFRSPHPERSEKEFIDFLIDCGTRYHGAVLFPAADESLTVVSRNKMLLETHFRVACTDWNITKRFIDKQFTYAMAEKCGVPAPKTLIPHSIAEARSCAKEIGFPCLVKPCQSHLFVERFGRKMVQVNSFGILEETFNMAIDAGLEVMLQELIPGADCNVVNYNSYIWEGEILTEFTAIHLRNGPPWVGSTRVAVSRDVPEVIEPGRRILQEVGFNGFACTEFKRDQRNGVYKLMEINGRHNLSTLLAVRCGINFPWLHYRHLSEGIAPSASEFQKEIYWIDIIRDVGFSGIFFFREGHSFWEYLRPYIKSHVFAIFDRKDLKPFIYRVSSLVKKGIGKLFGRGRSK